MSIATGQQALASEVLAAIITGHTSGSYTGNDTDNRAIAHGLGVTPKIVFILGSTATNAYSGIIIASGDSRSYNPTIVTATAPDTTNFYLKATVAGFAFNEAPINYSWIAIG